MKEKKERNYVSSGGGAVYCFGLIGALIYYLQNATSFGEGVLGILKALVWPGMIVHKVLTVLGM